ncbi:RodZ domain-containing protein [Colwelliaceae bacterium 6441]
MSKKKPVEELPEDIEIIGPGQMLSEGRAALGLTQQQVADKLNFRTALVKDIEADNFDRSLPATFNRGYLKNYAKLVNISSDDVLAGFEMLNVAQKQGAEMQSFSKETEKQAENNLVMWISYLILALLIGSTVLWWMQDAKQAKPATNESLNKLETGKQTQLKTTETSSSAVNKNITAADTSNTATLSETLKERPTIYEEKITAATEMESTLSQSVANNSDTTLVSDELTGVESTPEQTLENNGNEVVQQVSATPEVDFGPTEFAEFTFSGDCWVNIYDATGERIAWGIKKSGYVMNITGQAPFTITLGKPELVSIRFNDQLVDMSAFSRGNIAKFELPLN